MDEVELKVSGKKAWGINAIDSKTKYNLEGLFTIHKIFTKFWACFQQWRKLHLSSRYFFSLLKERIHDQILEGFEKEKHKPEKKRNLITFVSDGLAQLRVIRAKLKILSKFYEYKTCFEDFFGGTAKLIHGVPIACRKYGLEHNNNSIERHNEDIKQRYKIMREFKGFYSADDFLKLRRIIYNFVRSHSGLDGRTPAKSGRNQSQFR